MNLLRRLRYAWAAFKAAKHTCFDPEYAVIYDTAEADPGGEPAESYYGYFGTPQEAYRRFSKAYPKRDRDLGATEPDTECLVLILGPIDNYA